MKKVCLSVIALAIVLTLIASASAAAALSGKAFTYAKGALTALADGDFDAVVTHLPFSGVSPSAGEWKSFAENAFGGLIGSAPQTTYAVAYWTGSVWKVAVPVSTPDDPAVETFVLTSEDGESFIGYARAPWSSVVSEYQSASHVAWNDEYSGSTSAVIEFDHD